MQFYYTYVLRNTVSKSYYIGFTRNLRRRLVGHHSGDTRTTRKGKYELIYFEGYKNKADALGRERFLKGGSGRKYLKKQLRCFLSEATT